MCRLIRVIFSTLLLYCFVVSSGYAAAIRYFSVHSQPRAWRLTFGLSRAVPYRVFSLFHPHRLVIDFQGVSRHVAFSMWEYSKAPIKNLRVGRYRKKLRIVMDLPTSLQYRARLQRLAHHRANLIVKLVRRRVPVEGFQWPASSGKDRKKKIDRRKGADKKPVGPALVILPPVQRSKQVIVVIDPGHGGKDPGATGPRGYHEKNVVLAISRQLLRLINHEPGFKGYLTRTGDYYLTLRRRLRIARKYKADMFIAIHADAFRDNSARGASVFALSQRGATSEAARWLAVKENQSELMGGVDLSDKSHLLRSVLINLSQNASVRISLHIGADIIHSLSRFAALHHHKVEQAAFVVLKSPDIPSLLVETGFISNSYEERRLISPRYQHRLALALESGVVKYFTLHPPRGTWLASIKNKGNEPYRRYKVGRGDSLSRIAQLYRVSSQSIKSLNRLHGDRLLVGQDLLIPLS